MNKTPAKASLPRRILSCLLAVVLAAGLAPALPREAQAEESQARAFMGFEDVQPGDWYATDEVLGYAVDNGLLQGYDGDRAGQFGPYDDVTRAQVATILWRVAGEPDADAEDFSDVDYSLWYGAAVEWARTSGVVSGYGDTNTFGPDNPVTREQLAVMLSNYAGSVAGLDASSDCAALDAIAGASQVSSWAREQMGWAVDEGILSGSVDASGTAWVDPQGTAQRCQAAKMVSVFHRDVLDAGEEKPEVPDIDAPATVDYADDLVIAQDQTVGIESDDDSITAVVSGGADGISVGDVVMLNPGDGLPFGGAMKVTSIDRSEGGSTLVGTYPETSEIYDELVMRQHIGMEDIVDALPADGVSARAASLSKTIPVDKTFGKYGSISGSVTIEHLDGNVVFIPLGVFSYLDVDLECDVKPSLSFKASALPEKYQEIQIASIPIPYLGAAGCGVYLNVYLNLDVSGNVSVTMDTTLRASAEKQFFEPLIDLSGGVDLNGVDTLEISVDGKIGPSAGLALQVGTPIVEVGGEAGFAAHASSQQHPGLLCGDVSAWLYSELYAEVLGHATDMLSANLELWNESNSIFKKGFHFENGVLVPECTWGEASDDPSGEVSPENEFKYEIADWIEGAEARQYPLSSEAAEGRLYGCRLNDKYLYSDGEQHDFWAEEHGLGGVGGGVYPPTSFDCGHGAYVFGYEGSSNTVVVPESIDEEPVVFAAISLDEGQSLDLSKATSLKAIVVWGSNAGEIDFGTGDNLKSAFLEWVNGPYLDMNGQTGIEDLMFNVMNSGFGLDGGSLRSFFAYGSSLGVLNLSGCPLLEDVHVSWGILESLNVTNCPSLKYLDCTGSYLRELDISGCPNLVELYCQYNMIEDTSALEAWLAQPGHIGQIYPQEA